MSGLGTAGVVDFTNFQVLQFLDRENSKSKHKKEPMPFLAKHRKQHSNGFLEKTRIESRKHQIYHKISVCFFFFPAMDWGAGIVVESNTELRPHDGGISTSTCIAVLTEYDDEAWDIGYPDQFDQFDWLQTVRVWNA